MSNYELTFEQQEVISAMLEAYKNNPSNSNKVRYNLFAYIDEHVEQLLSTMQSGKEESDE